MPGVSQTASRTVGLSGIRDHNTRIFLQILLEAPDGLTKRELRRRSRLAEGTINNLVSRCSSLLSVAGVQPVQGPSATIWQIDPRSAYAVGIDLGRNHIAVALCDRTGRRVAARHQDRINALDNRDETIRVVSSMIKQCVGTARRCRLIAAVTVSVPGPVVGGGLKDPRYPDWAASLSKELGELWEPGPAPSAFLVENDANVRAFVERTRGAAMDALDAVVVKWSTGVGAGLILGGEIWRGTSGVAGELGHVRVRVDNPQRRVLGLTGDRWPPCSICGQIDCVDALAGGAALARAAGLGEDLGGFLGAVDDAASPEHDVALAAVHAGARIIGRALGPTMMMLDLDKVIVGGPLGDLVFDVVVDDLMAGLRESGPIVHASHEDGRGSGGLFASRADHGRADGALGAAWHALDHGTLEFFVRLLAENEGASAAPSVASA